ncbi:MAG: beta-lactamase family protein [Rhodothermales bacterium]|nr:beta-lactamase family protein [Rhodothermales bacterium]MBO6779904.1 beta-lactamase family protein [Rhodothermales bacterium]
MRNLPLFALLALAACGTDPHAESITRLESEVVKARIFDDEAGPTLEERMQQLGVPALSVAVLLDGEIAWARAWGIADSASGRAATTETLFQAASISKPVAATAMHDMVEDGLLTLDGNINDHLTSWSLPDNAFTRDEKVTLRRITEHSAGLTVWGFPGYNRDESLPTTAQVLDGEGNTDSVRVYKTPGESWQYSGGGYTIMQLAMAEAANQSFPDILQARVLEPAGMTSSGYWQPLPERLYDAAATGYRSSGAVVDGNWHVYPEMAAAGLWTTPSDLLRWSMTIMNDRAGAGTILDSETVETMLTKGPGGHGLGPSISEDGLKFGHGGANEGFRCNLMTFQDGRGGIAIMTNSDSGGTMAYEMLLTAAREYGWEGFEPQRLETTALTDDEVAALVGQYRYEPGLVTVEHEDGTFRLTSEWDGQYATMVPTSANELHARTDQDRVRLETADDGTMTLVWNDQWRGIKQ